MTEQLAAELSDEELYLVTNYRDLTDPESRRLILEIIGKLTQLQCEEQNVRLLSQLSGIPDNSVAA